jgi:hypothetical protein
MKWLDGRHKWEYIGFIDGADVHTCRVCGRTQRFERLIPDAFLDVLERWVMTPNPYRALRR